MLDIQGDGRADLLLMNWDSPNPFRFRLQTEDHQLGPEVHFTLPPVRSYWADDLDQDHRTEVVTVSQKSGRAQVYNFNQKNAEPLSGVWQQGQLQVLPLKRTAKSLMLDGSWLIEKSRRVIHHRLSMNRSSPFAERGPPLGLAGDVEP